MIGIPIQQLRELASIKNKIRTWVSELSDDQLEELFIRLKNGESAKAIARYAQDNWAVSPGSTVHSISQGIIKFKNRVSNLFAYDLCGPVDRKPAEDTLPVDDLENMERIALQQSERIDCMIAEEKRTKIMNPQLNKEILALSKLHQVIMKQKDWIIKNRGADVYQERRERKAEHDAKKAFGMIQELTRHDGGKALQMALSNFTEDLSRKAMTLETHDDGTYTLFNPDGTIHEQGVM